jgi:hypothetical protein
VIDLVKLTGIFFTGAPLPSRTFAYSVIVELVCATNCAGSNWTIDGSPGFSPLGEFEEPDPPPQLKKTKVKVSDMNKVMIFFILSSK